MKTAFELLDFEKRIELLEQSNKKYKQRIKLLKRNLKQYEKCDDCFTFV